MITNDCSWSWMSTSWLNFNSYQRSSWTMNGSWLFMRAQVKGGKAIMRDHHESLPFMTINHDSSWYIMIIVVTPQSGLMITSGFPYPSVPCVTPLIYVPTQTPHLRPCTRTSLNPHFVPLVNTHQILQLGHHTQPWTSDPVGSHTPPCNSLSLSLSLFTIWHITYLYLFPCYLRYLSYWYITFLPHDLYHMTLLTTHIITRWYFLAYHFTSDTTEPMTQFRTCIPELDWVYKTSHVP